MIGYGVIHILIGVGIAGVVGIDLIGGIIITMDGMGIIIGIMDLGTIQDIM
ncbi:hypothetical protein N8445_00165 [bacterium]|nr:hypothetical protein [bacterium]